MWYLAWDSAVLGGLVQARDGGEAIPPVVARIFSGDSTSPLTREASVVVQSKGWCGFGRLCVARGCVIII